LEIDKFSEKSGYYVKYLRREFSGLRIRIKVLELRWKVVSFAIFRYILNFVCFVVKILQVKISKFVVVLKYKF